MSTVLPTTGRRVRLFAALVGLTATAVVAAAADVVIMADGFTMKGRWFRESELMSDPGTGAVRVAKAGGFDVLDDGPRYVVFSRHAQKGGKLEENVDQPPLPAYKMAAGGVQTNKLPTAAKIEVGEFNAKWRRVLKVTIPPNPKSPGGGYENIHQQLVHLDPHFLMIVANSHLWQCGYLTAEQDPVMILNLLRTHPDLVDPEGKVDPMRRMNIASFFKDIARLANLRRRDNDWLAIARAELDKLRADAPGDWGKEADDRFAELQAEIDRVEARIVIDNVEAAVNAGRYGTAAEFLSGFDPKAIGSDERNRLAVLRATIEKVQPQYEQTARLLTDLIDRVGGKRQCELYAAVAGGPGYVYGPRPTISPDVTTILVAAGAVRAEVHPDSAPRLEIFRVLAEQAEKDRLAGREPAEQPVDLLAYAVTGWVKGKNAAEKKLPAAIRAWEARETILAYLREPVRANREALLAGYLEKAGSLGPEEIAQIITLLPPPLAEDAANPTGEKVPVSEAGAEGVLLCNTGSLPERPDGVNYYLHLPPEYHHGRAHPVLLALTNPGYPTAQLVGFLAQFADKYGYIVAAPEWTNQFSTEPYDYSGDDHSLVTETLRAVQRRFQVDPDRVFLYGYGDGANFALDVGLAHPDLFAGLVPNGLNPPTNIFLQYWHNAQKLPVYAIIGEVTGAFPNVRKTYEKWMTKGFPALLTVYKGRGLELFPLEMPRLFDWMDRKTRVRGAASLRLNQPGFEPWQVLRNADNRFYWVGVDTGGLRGGDRVQGWPQRAVVPAQFRADIGRNGVINIDRAIGINKFVVWLERDLIDWSKPIRVNVNGRPAREYRPKVLEPDLHLMLEELHRSGDRKMLYFGKLAILGDG